MMTCAGERHLQANSIYVETSKKCGMDSLENGLDKTTRSLRAETR